MLVACSRVVFVKAVCPGNKSGWTAAILWE